MGRTIIVLVDVGSKLLGANPRGLEIMRMALVLAKAAAGATRVELLPPPTT